MHIYIVGNFMHYVRKSKLGRTTSLDSKIYLYISSYTFSRMN
jgi:hypothetical protein